jgi:hypothetical protein
MWEWNMGVVETAKWIVELVWNGYTVVLVVDSMGL